jgi:LuxR family transcriptional regulator
MLEEQRIGDKLAALKELAPAGFAIALHIRFTTPTYLFQTYPKAWIDIYSSRGFLMRDPTVIWGFDNLGVIDWSELAADDSDGIMMMAREHGLVEGFTCAVEHGETRSISSFSRTDAAFADDEKSDICQTVEALHEWTSELGPLSAETREDLRRMSVRFTHPSPGD